MIRYSPLLVVGLLLSSGSCQALDAEQEHGQQLLQEMCAHCHAIGSEGASPNQLAPPFRKLGDDKLYDGNFAKRLQEGYSSIYHDMPTIRFDRVDAEAVVNYLKAIQEPQKSR